MPIDIRDKATVQHEDVIRLNFIRESAPYVFRRHYRNGLRSHIMELLDPADVHRERYGVVAGGIRWFPRATPLKMLRIFRTKFSSLSDATVEIQRVKVVEAYLGAEFLAMSEEFLIDYVLPHKRDFVLCGLQEYIQGDPVDPWRLSPVAPRKVTNACRVNDSMEMSNFREPIRDRRLKDTTSAFIGKVKAMIREAGLIPDIAGARNLLVTPSGQLKLVDINNISTIDIDDDIHLDDKGYPVCDKSVEALFLLEKKIVGRATAPAEEIYAHFLAPERVRRVDAIHRGFHQTVAEDRTRENSK